MTVSFDTVVLGAGPAGSVTAICLARMGWRVGIFESTAFDRERFGETLPPEVNPLLHRLGLWEPFLAQSPLESPGIVSTWGSNLPAEADFVRNVCGCGWHIDRNRFDRMLCELAAAAGAKVFLNHNILWAWTGGAWRSHGIAATFLVDAAGRHGSRATRTVGRIQEDALLSIAIRVPTSNRYLKDQRTWIEAAPAGWWYSTPLPDGSGLAMFFTGAEIYRHSGISMQEQLQAAPTARAWLSSGSAARAKVIYVPTGRRDTLFGENWVLVGDSASSYDPLSGRGIFKALRHGEAAARAIDVRLRGDRSALGTYATQVFRDFDAYTRERADFYAAERRWASYSFWQARSRPPVMLA
jgi:flavin-dependent dehydrogenase